MCWYCGQIAPGWCKWVGVALGLGAMEVWWQGIMERERERGEMYILNSVKLDMRNIVS